MTPDVLFIELCDYDGFPMGGQLSFARQMVHTFGSKLALVGISTDNTPIGRWVKKTINGRTCDFLSVARWKKSHRRPLVPMRLRNYCSLRRYRKQILSIDTRAAFIGSPEAILASHNWGWDSLCYYFAGLENPLRTSRYKWARPLAAWFDSRFLPALQSANLLLAAADEPSIKGFLAQTGDRLPKEGIISFPTRADTDIFHPVDRPTTRRWLGIPESAPMFVSVGRLNREKGWDLLLEAFQLLLRTRADAHFYFVGDGEDRREIEQQHRRRGLIGRVHITGCLAPQRVAGYLNAADVFVLGSHFEGWPTAMVEALATGKPIVSTSVSAAAELIENGKNGYIVDHRDAPLFCDMMVKALSLDAHQDSLEKSRPYALDRLAEDLGNLWPPLRP